LYLEAGGWVGAAALVAAGGWVAAGAWVAAGGCVAAAALVAAGAVGTAVGLGVVGEQAASAVPMTTPAETVKNCRREMGVLLDMRVSS
jgi:carbonic anhydrase/acetyltransferase-like protein (isoleucine patch superfamily)